MKMRWVSLQILLMVTVCCLAKDEDESNELSVLPQTKNLNSDLRRALLKALTELENEDSAEYKSTVSGDKIVEKASASAVSIFANSASASTPRPTIATPTPSQTTEEQTRKPIIYVQRSQAIEHAPITTVEKEDLDPFGEAEQILTSATSSFQSPSKSDEVESRNAKTDNSVNLIKNDEKSTTKLRKVETTTPVIITSSTEENEAKVEDVQFFSAPLVAAFTVHQDELGIPKKVESIFKPVLTKEQEKEIQLRQQAKLKEDQLKQEQEQKHREIAAQLELQQKQAALEQEIARLNLSLQQQQQLNQQQKEFFLRQQEQVRLRNNERPFLPIVNPSFGQFNTQGPILNQKASLTTEKPGVNQFNSNLIVPSVNQPLPVKSAQVFNQNSDQSRNSVTLHPSITFNPLIEAGKLPPNAQILPVKGPINFHTPIIQTPGFQQFHSLSNVGPTPLVNNFNQLQTVQPQFNVIDNQGNRFFRQEFGVGNFLNNDVNKVSPSFSIQKSVAPPQQLLPGFNNFVLSPPLQQNNRFFRSNAESSQNIQQPQNNRYFRSNLESSYRSPSHYDHSNLRNYQLQNLLYSSGAFREKSPVDINIISKVLSYNHSGDSQFASSRRRDTIKEV